MLKQESPKSLISHRESVINGGRLVAARHCTLHRLVRGQFRRWHVRCACWARHALAGERNHRCLQCERWNGRHSRRELCQRACTAAAGPLASCCRFLLPWLRRVELMATRGDVLTSGQPCSGRLGVVASCADDAEQSGWRRSWRRGGGRATEGRSTHIARVVQYVCWWGTGWSNGRQGDARLAGATPRRSSHLCLRRGAISA